MIRGKEIELSPELVDDIKNWGENVFADACTSKENLEVTYQIPVGQKLIDFKVKNKKVNGRSEGTLVEVTSTIKKNAKKGKKKQKRVMVDSGKPNTVLYGENLSNIQEGLRKKREDY